jgi:excisionase family DNA binding protein
MARTKASYAPHVATMEKGTPVAEAAKILHMHPETMRRLIREKKIKATRSLNQIGHGYVISDEEIERIKAKGISFESVTA